MSYARVIPVEFNHCDPAGIVFYPRYFEMVNSLVENFFGDVLKAPFARIHMAEGCGVPTAKIAATFHAPSRLGDRITFTLRVERVGGASAALAIDGVADGVARLSIAQTIVWIDRTGKAAPWPDTIRAGLEAAS